MGSCRALVVACVLALTAVAGAQPKPPSAVQKQQAGELVKKAIAKSQAGDHVGAIELYNQAYNIIPTSILLSNIGSEYQQMAGKQVEAIKYFCKYLEADPAGSNVEYVTAQTKALQAQQNVSVDDKDVCKPVVKPIVKPVIKATPPPEPVDKGAPPSTAVMGTTGLAGPPAPAAAEHPAPGRTLELAGLGVGAVGIAATIVGIYYGVQARDKSDYITNYTKNPATAGMSWPVNIRAIWDEGQSDSYKGIGLMIGGGLAVVGGAAMIYIGRGKSAATTEHVSIVPMATPTSVGLALELR